MALFRMPRPIPRPHEVLLVIICVLLWHYVIQLTAIRGGSMVPTLHDGDRAFVVKTHDQQSLLPRGAISRQTVVQCREPGHPSNLLVKRIIGMPGDRVRIVDETVIVNHSPLVEPYKVMRSNLELRAPFESRIPREPLDGI